MTYRAFRRSLLNARFEPPRRWYLPVVLIAGLAMFFAFEYLDLGTRRNRRTGDATVRRMYEHINVGTSRQHVLDVFWRDKQFGSLLDTNMPNVWTALPYGTRTSSSWLLVVEFQADHVSAVKVRNVDGVNPPSAPIDKTNNASQ